MMTLTYIGIGIVIVVIVIAAGIFIALQTPKKKKDASAEYISALNYLIHGDQKMALEKLRQSVRYNTYNIDAYIKIGDILRDQGVIDRAITIHRALTFRRDLNSGQKIEILKSLIKDYQAIPKYDRAMLITEKLLDLTHNEVWAQEIKLKLYEDSNDWDKAFDMLKNILKEKGKKNGQLLALYKIEAGLKCIEEGKEKEGRIKFREAIKLDKKCPPAYLYLSDSYIRENRYDDALTELKKFITLVPQLSHLGFNRIKDILFHEGNFGEVENIFQLLLEKNPENESIRFSLADIYERKGELKRAITLCNNALERNPNSKEAKRYLAKFLAHVGETDKALEYALELTETLMKKYSENFICKKCGYVSNEPKWRCPQCHEWNSFFS